MAVAQANLDTLNTAIDSLHTALDVVLNAMASGEELVFTEDTGQNKEAQTIKGAGVRRIVLYSPTAGRPEAAGYDSQSLDSIRALFGEGTFTSTDAT